MELCSGARHRDPGRQGFAQHAHVLARRERRRSLGDLAALAGGHGLCTGRRRARGADARAQDGCRPDRAHLDRPLVWASTASAARRSRRSTIVSAAIPPDLDDPARLVALLRRDSESESRRASCSPITIARTVDCSPPCARWPSRRHSGLDIELGSLAGSPLSVAVQRGARSGDPGPPPRSRCRARAARASRGCTRRRRVPAPVRCTSSGLCATMTASYSVPGPPKSMARRAPAFSASGPRRAICMRSLRDNPECCPPGIRPYRAGVGRSGMQPVLSFEPGPDGRVPGALGAVTSGARERPPVAILRDQGVNGHAEMAAAFHQAGFRCLDVHMTRSVRRPSLTRRIRRARGVRRVQLWRRARGRAGLGEVHLARAAGARAFSRASSAPRYIYSGRLQRLPDALHAPGVDPGRGPFPALPAESRRSASRPVCAW